MRLHRLIDPLVRLRLRLARRKGPASGVLLVSAGGLGDTVLFAVLLPRFLRLATPGEDVTVLLRSDAAKMAFLFPTGVAVRKVDFGRLRDIGTRLRVFADLHRAHYRLVVHTDYLRHPDLDEALVAACMAPETAAMEPRPSEKHRRRLMANRSLYRRLFDSGPTVQDKVLRWARFADFLTGRTLPPPSVSLPHARVAPARLAHPTVVLQPFSAVKLKQSPPELWELIIGTLPAGWQVLLAGHPGDLDKNPEFRSLLERPNVTFEGAPFERLAGILMGARMAISVDTACMHLAAALGVPTLCLASAAYVGEIVPYAEAVMPANLHVLYTPVDCKGCLGACWFPPEDGMYPCVAALDPDLVLGAVRDMVARGL
ncbi:MAG: glycosyltransferase family 9 protein [Magnetospirillum sp.]|nr:glycosyltransferase family 9 protein [Magnetospirillum sp.]